MSKKDNNPASSAPGSQDPRMGKYSVKTNSKKINKREALIRILTIVLIILLLLLFGLFACTTYINKGNFTVETGADAFNAGLSLSETKDFKTPTRILRGSDFTDMREGTYPLIPGDIADYEGSKNFITSGGMYYYTYSFYVKNAGKDDAGYSAQLNINSATQGTEDAMRVMIVVDGKGEVYGKPKLATTKVLDVFSDKNFISNRKVATVTNDNFKSGDINKITVVIWFEGEDPECVDDIIGGEVKLSMDLNLIQKPDNGGEAA